MKEKEGKADKPGELSSGQVPAGLRPALGNATTLCKRPCVMSDRDKRAQSRP
jgi:hypothetical protein